VDAAGDVSVTADNEAKLNATVSNAARSTASALWKATGSSMGGAIALNRMAGGAKAYILDRLSTDTIVSSVTADGAVTVSADDMAELYSNVKIVTSSITTNDGGAAVLGETVNDFVPSDYETRESRDEFGNTILRDVQTITPVAATRAAFMSTWARRHLVLEWTWDLKTTVTLVCGRKLWKHS